MTNREHFMAVVDQICKRPGMFTGTESLRGVANYLDGLDHGLALATGEKLLRHMDWYRWLEGEYVQGLQGQQWPDFLSERFGSDKAALESLPRLYRAFFADLDSIGEAGIHDRASRRILARQVERDPNSPLN
jgi:hypothetical protein